MRKQAYKKLRIGTDRNGILCEYFDDKEKGSPYPAQMVFATALAPNIPNNEDTPVTAATPQTESAPAIIYGMCDVEKALRRIKSKSNHTPADFTQPDALYMDDSYSDAPGDNSCPEQDIPHNRTHNEIPAEIAQSEYIPDDILTLVLQLAYTESYDDIFDILKPIHSYQLRFLAHISGITEIPRCDNNKKSIKFRLAERLFNQFSCIVAGYPKDFTDLISRIFKEVCSQNPRLKNAKKFPVHNNPGFTIVKRNVSIIKRPPYRKIHDTPQDECPYTTVYACDFPTYSPTAVVPYAEAAPIRKIYRIISIFIRLWIGLHSPARSDVIRSHVFAPWFIELADYAPGNPNDISPLIYKWQRKKFSEKLKLCRSQIATCKTREQIIACLQNVSSESIRLLCVADRVFSKTTRIAAPECERKLAYAQFYADKIIQRREKSTPVHAEINDFTPKPEPQPKTKPRKLEAANDSEHKLIETKDLHFQERRNALDHNAAVISSCLFHEAIVSMLLKISPAAIIQLGFHMGLFIAKPKGKKIAIAEAFAKRLF